MYNEFAKYISSLFLQGPDKYHISAYFAYNYLYRGEPKADAIIFPSIQIQKRAVNYAIRTDIVDSKMKIKHLYHISVDSIDFDKELIATSLYAIGTLKDKKITWTKVDKKNKRHVVIFKQFHKDFGENV